MTEQQTTLSDEMLASCVEELGGVRRRARQEAAHALAAVAHDTPERIHGFVPQLVEALYRPEAQTRWEVLDALSCIASERADLVADACDGAEAALFDESSSSVRESAFRFLSCFGATTPERSNAVWLLLDEAVQCYHGDPEYRDMLASLLLFAQGSLSDETRAALIERVSFDAEHGHGYIKAFSGDILKALSDAADSNGE